MRPASKFVITLGFALAACAPASAAALININTASATQLETLKGIGPTYAARIVAYRAGHPFAAIADIQNVKGIGPATFANIKDFITVGVVETPMPGSAPVQAPAPKITAAVVVPKARAQTVVKTESKPVDQVDQVDQPNKTAAFPQMQVAAVGESAPAFPLSAVLLGLAGLVGLGAAGVWYARAQSPKKEEEENETPIAADEFIIE